MWGIEKKEFIETSDSKVLRQLNQQIRKNSMTHGKESIESIKWNPKLQEIYTKLDDKHIKMLSRFSLPKNKDNKTIETKKLSPEQTTALIQAYVMQCCDTDWGSLTKYNKSFYRNNGTKAVDWDYGLSTAYSIRQVLIDNGYFAEKWSDWQSVNKFYGELDDKILWYLLEAPKQEETKKQPETTKETPKQDTKPVENLEAPNQNTKGVNKVSETSVAIADDPNIDNTKVVQIDTSKNVQPDWTQNTDIFADSNAKVQIPTISESDKDTKESVEEVIADKSTTEVVSDTKNSKEKKKIGKIVSNIGKWIKNVFDKSDSKNDNSNTETSNSEKKSFFNKVWKFINKTWDKVKKGANNAKENVSEKFEKNINKDSNIKDIAQWLKWKIIKINWIIYNSESTNNQKYTYILTKESNPEEKLYVYTNTIQNRYLFTEDDKIKNIDNHQAKNNEMLVLEKSK